MVRWCIIFVQISIEVAPNRAEDPSSNTLPLLCSFLSFVQLELISNLVNMMLRRPLDSEAASRFFRCFFDLHRTPAATHHNASRSYTTKHLSRPSTNGRGQSTSFLNRRYEHSAASAPSTTTPPSPTQSQSEEETLSTHLRLTMRLVPHPITLITSCQPPHPEIPPGEHSPPESHFRGATVSSFNTVTLAPTPLISLNIRLPSSTFTAMQASSTFLAHVLAANSRGARIADAFARGDASAAFAKLVGGGDNQSDDSDPTSTKQDEVQVFTGRATGGAPLVASPGVIQVLRCRPLPGKEVQVGDHVVLVAEVLSILSPPQQSTSARQEEVHGLNYMRSLHREADGEEEAVHGLVYLDGRYSKIGVTVDIAEDPAEENKEKQVQLQKPKQEREVVHRTLGMNVRRGDEHMR